MSILLSILIILFTALIIVACCLIGILPFLFTLLIFLGSFLIFISPFLFIIYAIISGIKSGPTFARMILKRKSGKLYYLLSFIFSCLFAGLITYLLYIWIAAMS